MKKWKVFTMKKIFNNPYLPDRQVENAFISCQISDKIESKLKSYGITCYKTVNCENINISVSSHPDMLFFKADNVIYVEKNNKMIIEEIAVDIKQTIIIGYNFGAEQLSYPEEAALNGLFINGYLICNKKTFKPEIENITHIINVKQGYTKCSLCVVDEGSFITEDKGMYKALTANGFDVLYIEPGEVKLKGYDHGFIGGASGKLDKNILAFTGDITKHSAYNKISEFVNARGIECISLSDEPLYDYGSIIAIS